MQSLTASIKQAKAQSAKAVAKQNVLTGQISAGTTEKDDDIEVPDAATKNLADLTATCEQKSSDFKSVLPRHSFLCDPCSYAATHGPVLGVTSRTAEQSGAVIGRP